MLDKRLQYGLAALAITVLMVYAVAVHSASALTPRDFQYLQDNHKTDRFPGGQHVCGDHLCSPQEWSAMKQALDTAQRNPSECSSLKEWRACIPTNQTTSG